MKHLLKNRRSLWALALSMMLLMSMSTVAFAADDTINNEDEISTILAKINAEYGTNIHVLSENELAQYGLIDAEPQTAATYEIVDLEETLRYIAEVQIPKFERTSQEANSVIAALSGEANALSVTAGTVIAKKDIDYATAGAEAYITTNSYGNTVWGSIVKGLCYTNMYQETWFMASNPTVTHTDGKRTLYWTGEGDYCAYINGTQYYLYSGTQYASMYVGDYD